MREHSLQDIFRKIWSNNAGSVDQILSIADFLQWGMSNVRAIKLYNCSTVISFQCSVLLPGVGGRSAVTSCWYLFVSCTTCYIISLSKNNMKYSYGSDSIVNEQSLVNPELSISKSYVWRTNSSPHSDPSLSLSPNPPCALGRSRDLPPRTERGFGEGTVVQCFLLYFLFYFLLLYLLHHFYYQYHLINHYHFVNEWNHWHYWQQHLSLPSDSMKERFFLVTLIMTLKNKRKRISTQCYDWKFTNSLLEGSIMQIWY